jgi:AcrR family transcriptional regulator
VIERTVCASKDTPRAEVQRERILCAAQKCFIEHGFHAASMANIAAAAQMSAGLMYRYFENKSAIVKAIVERQLQDGRAQIEQLHTSADLVASLLQTYRLWLTRDPAVMNPALYRSDARPADRRRPAGVRRAHLRSPAGVDGTRPGRQGTWPAA